MKFYTIVLLLPDYVAENYGQDTYISYIKTGDDLVIPYEKAQKEVWRAYDKVGSFEDYLPIFVCHGWQENLRGEMI